MSGRRSRAPLGSGFRRRSSFALLVPHSRVVTWRRSRSAVTPALRCKHEDAIVKWMYVWRKRMYWTVSDPGRTFGIGTGSKFDEWRGNVDGNMWTVNGSRCVR
ncbi:hypothetical protein CERSUDRAFT_82971 [Gelatoporia subvermispora B]|uniref:Uncharacterized protein n=1 Tax=Ceriporiopsis subvermispora (strain B) TaxID=914234 RepID=M2PQ79_CERS8|nr:hypothetical protein CERSUDRAFT_82971 [Gelatoporia subvermispora B]